MFFESFIEVSNFNKFITKTIKISATRFNLICDVIFESIRNGGDHLTIASIGAIMATPQFQSLITTHFKPPYKPQDSYPLMKGLLNYCIQSDGLEEMNDLLFSQEYALLLQDYIGHPSARKSVINMTMFIMKVKRSSAYVRSCAEKISEDAIRNLILMSEVVGTMDVLLSSITQVFTRHPEPDRFFNMLQIYAEQYCPSQFNSPTAIQSKFSRLADLWCVFGNARDLDIGNIRSFIDMYGHDQSGYKRYIWDIVVGTEPLSSLEAISIVTASEFQTLCKNYMLEQDTVKILIYNIIQALDINAGKYRNALLKSILHTKIDKLHFVKRGKFIDWFLKNVQSRRIAGVINEYFFHEHISESLLRESIPGTCRVPEFRNKGHRLFCYILDKIQPISDMPPEILFRKIITVIRDSLWKPVTDNFQAFRREINDIRSIAEIAGLEDQILYAMESMRQEDLIHYHRHLLTIWLDSPGMIKKAVNQNDWYKVLFSEAIPYCTETIIPLIGMISVRSSGDEKAFTDGKVIYLPSYINLFNDSFMPLEANRNLSSYIAFSLHEAGHILCGSYHFNIKDFVNSLERPQLFRIILNVFEDYRIESFIVRMNVHPQANKLFSMVKRRQLERLAKINISPGANFLFYIVHMADSNNFDAISNEDYFPKINEFLDMNYYSGEFCNLRELASYGIQRLINLDIANPLSAIILAEIFYNIMKFWPEDALNGMGDTIMLPPSEVMNGCTGEKSKSLTREQLNELYNLCNGNIQRFLARHGINAFPDLISDNSNNNQVGYNTGYIIPDYENLGTIDKSTRTLLDDLVAGEQITSVPQDDEPAILAYRQSNSHNSDISQEESREKSEESKTKKKIKDIRVGSKSHTRLSELKEFSINNVNLSYMAMFQRWEPIVRRVYDELSRLIPLIDDEIEITSEGGDIDSERLIEILSDHKNRFIMPEFFETLCDESRHSLEVLIGLDASGSTSAIINMDGTTILDIEKAFSIILGRALRFITPEVRAYAFNSQTSTNIYRAESFEAISSFKSSEGNRDGDFIRYLTSLLKKSSADSRFIFLLSDGKPCSINYNGREAMEDTLLAMREAVNAGIKLIYYNFDKNQSDYFDLLKKEATYARYFTDPAQILPTIPEMLKKITSSVI